MKKVLIIDDSETSLYLIKSVFENDREIDVDIENNSTHALSSIKNKKPDLILLDLMMPHVDGFQILLQLKADVDFSKIPIIVLSARQDKEAINMAFEYGAVDYIQKPIKINEIKTKIRRIFYKESAL